MSAIAIQAENISKRYNVATAKHHHDTVADQIADSVKSFFRTDRRVKPHERIFWALKDVSFEISQGEILGIIGQNGAGKSTLLKILSQITVPTEGRVSVYGRIGSLLEVGTGFHPELTGRENIYLNGAIIGMKRDEIRRQFDAIVEFSGVGAFLEMPVKRYSSGMYVRLAFAVAAHLEPEILLLDEVLAVGDTAFQKKCMDKIGDVANGGRTVIFISHNMTAINSLCKRVMWINNGGIVEDGPSADVVTKYLTSSVTDMDEPEEIWDDPASAPGNDMVRLHRVCLRNDNGPLTMKTPFQVVIDYWNLVPDVRLNVALHMYTADGVIAFSTGNLDECSLSMGLYRSACHVPGNLLNSGLHRVVVLVVKDTSCVIHEHESRVPINILDLRERDGNWYGKEPGVVQPLLGWTTEFIDGVNATGDFSAQSYPA